MGNIELLRQKVEALYNEKQSGADLWAPYLAAHHVFLVADKAGELADRFGGEKNVAMAAGMLHDIADAVMERTNPDHSEESKRIARIFLRETDFPVNAVATIVEDALPHHSCRGDIRPHSLEGKVMASADAIIHLTTDFYAVAEQKFRERGETGDAIKKWALEKIDRDVNTKIFFDAVREEVRPAYEKLKVHFESL